MAKNIEEKVVAGIIRVRKDGSLCGQIIKEGDHKLLLSAMRPVDYTSSEELMFEDQVRDLFSKHNLLQCNSNDLKVMEYVAQNYLGGPIKVASNGYATVFGLSMACLVGGITAVTINEVLSNRISRSVLKGC